MKMRCGFLILVAFMLTGCEAVYLSQPLGEKVVVLDKHDWEGTWLAGDVVMVTTVLDAQNGRFEAAWIERGEQGAELEKLRGQIRIQGDQMFANIDDEGSESGKRFHWLKVELEDSHMTVWSPDAEAFKQAVARGSIPGQVIDGGVLLGALEAEHLLMIDDAGSGLMDWKEPAMFSRIGR